MNIVLFEPEIHWNTGNIGRSCVATGSTLHLVGKLGFSLDAKEIRRSGLDYWAKLDLKVHASFEDFIASLPQNPSLLFFSTKGTQSFWDASYDAQSYLIFGKETAGLPKDIHERYGRQMYRVPVGPNVRSINLSSCAAVVLFEALRQTGFKG